MNPQNQEGQYRKRATKTIRLIGKSPNKITLRKNYMFENFNQWFHILFVVPS